MKNVLVTGAAGFIGSALCMRLLERGDEVVGIDNLNGYYDVRLKEARLERIFVSSEKFKGFVFEKADISDKQQMSRIFREYSIDRVVNLAAQAGVRYSIENPQSYIDTNLVGFGNVLEGCRNNDVEHLVYASSSSVYGSNETMPFSVHHNVDHPASLYAASKKANELMAHAYSHLFRLPTTGLRFFTVYGPWGRPDMALFKFTRNILAGEPIEVFNYGNHRRDFTYIDDIVEGTLRALDNAPTPDPNWSGRNPDPGMSSAPWRIYNIGNGQPVELMKYVEVLEECLGKRASKELLPLQPGDVPNTWADTTTLEKDVGYTPCTSVEAGVSKFVDWYRSYYLV